MQVGHLQPLNRQFGTGGCIAPDPTIQDLATHRFGHTLEPRFYQGAFFVVEAHGAVQDEQTAQANHADQDPHDLDDCGRHVERLRQTDQNKAGRRQVHQRVNISGATDQTHLQQRVRHEVKPDTRITSPVVNGCVAKHLIRLPLIIQTNKIAPTVCAKANVCNPWISKLSFRVQPAFHGLRVRFRPVDRKVGFRAFFNPVQQSLDDQLNDRQTEGGIILIDRQELRLVDGEDATRLDASCRNRALLGFAEKSYFTKNLAFTEGYAQLFKQYLTAIDKIEVIR